MFQTNLSAQSAPNYAVPFDLYDMHEFSDLYCPDDKNPIQPEALYKELLRFQARSPENDAAITIPENYAARYDGEASLDRYSSYLLDAGTAGKLMQEFIQDPYEENRTILSSPKSRMSPGRT